MKITVHSLFRDSEKHLDRVLKQFEALESVAKCNFKFYENDSKDLTLEILKDWGKAEVFSETLNSPKFGSVTSNVRTSLLAYYRNKLKTLAGEPETEYTLLVDSDLFFGPEDLEGLIKELDEKIDTVMVTPNTQQNIKDYMFGLSDSSFYDVFCFRDQYGSNGAYFSSCPFYNNEDRAIWMDEKSVRTFSSFAGFALIKSYVYEATQWSADKHSEHVNFCSEVNRFGNILAVPTVKTRVDIDLSKLNLVNIKKIAENQRAEYNSTNILHEMSKSDEYKFKEILNRGEDDNFRQNVNFG